MKKILFLLSLLVSAGITTFAQSANQDFIVIDNPPNAEQLKTLYNGQANSVVIVLNQIMAPQQIANAISDKKVNDLHIYVSTKPGALGFCNMTLNADNISDQTGALKQWTSHVTGNVVIHSVDVFTSTIGQDLKTKLESATGLNFIMQ